MVLGVNGVFSSFGGSSFCSLSFKWVSSSTEEITTLGSSSLSGTSGVFTMILSQFLYLYVLFLGILFSLLDLL